MKTRRRIARHQVFIMISLPVLALFSCREGIGNSTGIFSSGFVDEEAFMTILQKSLPKVDTADISFKISLCSDLNVNIAYTYQLGQYKPLWFDAAGITAAAKSLPGQILSLTDEGITGNYDTDYLDYILQHSSGGDIPADSVAAWDMAFTRSYLSVAKDILLGEDQQTGDDQQWFTANDSLFDGASYLVGSLKNNSRSPSFDYFRPAHKAYTQMLETTKTWKLLSNDSTYNSLKQSFAAHNDTNIALQVIRREIPDPDLITDSTEGETILKKFQYYHQLRQTGKLDSSTIAQLGMRPQEYISKLQLNMARLRRLPKTISTEYIWVNIPLMELDYVKDDNRKFHARVVVGKTTRQTPSILAKMTNIVFNPPWGVPPTILKNDVGPGVSRSGSGYLSRKGLRAYDSKGRDVTANVNSDNYRRFSYRQPPGARNSLGEIKFNLPNKWDIYIHDTPHKENTANRMRALSSGCIRVQYPKDFAAALLDGRDYTTDKIDSVIETRKTKLEKLNRKIEVYIVYLTVAPDSTGSRLMYLNDIYKRDNHSSAIEDLSASR